MVKEQSVNVININYAKITMLPKKKLGVGKKCKCTNFLIFQSKWSVIVL